jgi:hypothetical protein
MCGTVNPRPPQLAASFISNQACDVACGTNRTNRTGLMMSVDRGRPEVSAQAQNGAFDPERDISGIVGRWYSPADDRP